MSKSNGKNGKTLLGERRLYIAYGSNLSYKKMRERCPSAKPVGKLLLDGARLVFRGVADLIYEPGRVHPVGLWEISATDEERLDMHEGVHLKRYGKFRIKLPDGRVALLYLMLDKGVYPPSAWYVNIVRNGYRNFGLEECFLDEAIRYSYEQKEPTMETRRRRAQQKLIGYQRRLVKLPESLALERIEQERRRRHAV